jgi:hypothetical protein
MSEAKHTPGQVTESIFNGKAVIVPLADVQHIESWAAHSVPGIRVITKHTRWDFERNDWANSIWMSEPEASEFKFAWCRYRSELESKTLINLAPAKAVEGASELLNGCNALLGLIQLVCGRDDIPPAIKEALENSHRVTEARAAIAKATGAE